MNDAGNAADLLERAIEGCEQEPIHAPGAVQPHGTLFALGSFENGMAPVLATTADPAADQLDEWLDDRSTERVLDASRRLGAGASVALPRLRDRTGGWWASVLLRRSGPVPFILALEPEELADPAAPDGSDTVLHALNEATERLAGAADIGEAARIAAGAVRSITGFDRVMTYRFDPDWSGVVIGESLGPRDGIASFTGLRFPASDIPPQARALYETDRVRVIGDATAAPVTIRARRGAAAPRPLDLTGVAIRAVSPVHLAYLANMGVRASMSVAVRDAAGRLWGLLACHHEAGPLRPPPPVRIAAELIARALGNRVEALRAESGIAGRARVASLRERIITDAGAPDIDLGALLRPLGPALAASLAADRVLVVEGEATVFATGDDGASAPGGLVAALERIAPDGVAALDHVAGAGLGEAGGELVADGLAGLLAHRLVDGAADPGSSGRPLPAVWLLFLRAERRRDVTWAGNPDKNPIVTARGLPILSPRHSFAAWNEEVRFHSDPFTPADLAAAAAIADALARALAQRSAAAARAVRELRLRNEQIRFFADAAVHDLREPLWQIQVFAGMLREELAGGAGPGGRSGDVGAMAEVIESSSSRMRDMVDDLSRFAMAGADPDRLRPRSVVALLREAEADLRERLQSAGGHVAMPPDDATVSCDGAQLRRVFQNLLSNSIKYRDRRRTLAVTIRFAEPERGFLLVDYADNGTGFDPADAERIFEPFRRLRRERDDEADPAASDGLGLGLAICRRIVEGHGGTVVARGTPGDGARFLLSLPFAGPHA